MLPDSRMPRRLSIVTSTMKPMPSADPVRLQLREGRDQRGHAGGDADRDGQDVADQQRRAGGQRRQLAEVVLGHDVAAAAVRVGLDRLPVGDADDDQQQR